MCYGRLVFAEMPLEIRQYETDTHASMASVTVQPRRVAHMRIASLCRAMVCWSWGDTRADRATRMGDTKPPGKWRKPTVAFPEVRGSQIAGGKPLLL